MSGDGISSIRAHLAGGGRPTAADGGVALLVRETRGAGMREASGART